MTERSGALQEDPLYMSYAKIVGRSCGEEEEEAAEEEEEEEVAAGEEDGENSSIHVSDFGRCVHTEFINIQYKNFPSLTKYSMDMFWVNYLLIVSIINRFTASPILHFEFEFFSPQKQETRKQRLIFNQARLNLRGVAEMVLLHISAAKGQQSEMVMTTLELGISVLRGGNIDIQMVC